MIKNRALKVLSILFLLLVLCAGRVGAVATILFEPYVTYSVVTPHAVGVGDFNHDGLNDAAVTNLTGVGFAGELKIFLQNITGSLDSAVAYAAGTRTEALAVGDLNNDGWDDVVVTNANSNTISVFLQQANGTLAARTIYVTGIGPDAVAVGDVNGDGLDDVAVANWNSAFISIFIQNGSGTLNAKVDYASPQAGYDDIAIGDVNGDGLNDVVKMNGQLYANPDLSVFTQTGMGTLNSAVSYSVTGNLLGSGIGIGDVTGDGKTDVVMSYGGNTPTAFIAVFAQLGNGTLKPPVSYTTYDVPEALEVADVNEDGLADVIVAHGGWNATSVHLQQNDGTLGSYSLYALPNNSASHYKPQGLAIGDINADTLLDVLVANYNFGLNVLYHVPPNTDIFIGGTKQASYYVSNQGSLRVSYAGVDSGPVEVVSTNGLPIVAGLRELFSVNGLPTSSAQMMGLPSSQLSDTYWFPSYNNVTLNEQVRFGNVDVIDTNVTVTIGATSFGPYLLHPNEQMRVNYAGVDSGPVKVQSSGGVKIIAAIRDAWLQGTVVESFSQLMGLPDSQLSDTYWFPAYNNVTLNEQLRFGNVGVADTNVTVTIGATSYGPYLLHPNEQFRINYAGMDSGPVKVQSSGGVKIIAAIREAWIQNGTVQSWIQLMGLPAPQLSDTYYFPAYDNVTLNGQLRFGNVDTTNTTVTVTIGGVVKGSYPLTPNQQFRVNYAGLDSGPVVIKSSGGVKIIAALRDALIVNGIVESFAQMMGLPGTQLSDTYMLPAYNNVTLSEELRIGVP